MIFWTILIFSTIIIISYSIQLFVVLRKLLKFNVYKNKEKFIVDLIPWIPFFPFTLIYNFVAYFINSTINFKHTMIKVLNKFKALDGDL